MHHFQSLRNCGVVAQLCWCNNIEENKKQLEVPFLKDDSDRTILQKEFKQNFSVVRLGELQRQNKSISSKRPLEIQHNETKIVKIRQAVLEIFNFKDLDLDSFPRKTTENRKCCFLEVLQKLSNCDVTNDNCKIKQYAI